MQAMDGGEPFSIAFFSCRGMLGFLLVLLGDPSPLEGRDRIVSWFTSPVTHSRSMGCGKSPSATGGKIDCHMFAHLVEPMDSTQGIQLIRVVELLFLCMYSGNYLDISWCLRVNAGEGR
jgi:hypothetical protein